MLRFLGKTTTSMATSGGSSPTELFGAVVDGLSTWELVNASQSDEEDLYSYDSADAISESDGITSDSDDDTRDEPDPNTVQEMDVGDDCIISIQALSISPPTTFPVEVMRNYAQSYNADEGYDDDLRDVTDVNLDVDDDHDDDNMYDFDFDDELVPWKLKDKYGKQRIKKMLKRGGPKPKLIKSKGLPYYDNRPGFSYGKFRGSC